MILVLLGTQDKSFERLLVEIDRLIKIGKIKEKVVVQRGYTEYQSEQMELFDFTDPKEIDKLMKQANYIICHAGVGTITTALKLNKVVVAVPRLKEYEEHTNDHQLQILNKFEQDGYIIGVRKVNELSSAIEKVKSFKPKKFQNNNDKMIQLIIDCIEH